jgi:hypothetical protein
MAADKSSLNDRMNAALRHRMGSRRVASPQTVADLNDFIRGRRRPFVEEPEMEQLADLRESDLIAFYGLAPDVRARVDTYVAAREAAEPEDAA